MTFELRNSTILFPFPFQSTVAWRSELNTYDFHISIQFISYAMSYLNHDYLLRVNPHTLFITHETQIYVSITVFICFEYENLDFFLSLFQCFSCYFLNVFYSPFNPSFCYWLSQTFISPNCQQATKCHCRFQHFSYEVSWSKNEKKKKNPTLKKSKTLSIRFQMMNIIVLHWNRNQFEKLPHGMLSMSKYIISAWILLF